MTQETDVLFGYWSAVRRRLGVVIAVGVAAAATSFGVSRLMPKVYSARAAIYALEGSGSLASALNQLPLAALGLAAPSKPADYLVAILESDTVTERVAARHDLGHQRAFAGKRDLSREELLEALRERTHLRVEGNKVVIAVETGDPRLSADVANEYVQQLERSVREFSRGKGEFLGGQLEEQKAELERAQEALSRFQSRRRAVALDAQAAEIVKAIADLKAQQIENGIALEQNATALKTSGVVEELVRLRVEKELLERKAKDLDQAIAAQEALLVQMPAAMTEFARLTWEVTARQAVVDILENTYQRARIAEQEENARYQILDRAVPPEKPVRPKTLLNTAAAGVLGLLVGMLWVGVASARRPRTR